MEVDVMTRLDTCLYKRDTHAVRERRIQCYARATTSGVSPAMTTLPVLFTNYYFHPQVIQPPLYNRTNIHRPNVL